MFDGRMGCDEMREVRIWGVRRWDEPTVKFFTEDEMRKMRV